MLERWSEIAEAQSSTFTIMTNPAYILSRAIRSTLEIVSLREAAKIAARK
jgi:hypothetical protein